MKIYIKRLLQFFLGFETYLFLFARYIVFSLGRNKKEGDFMYFLKMLHDGDVVLDIGANIGVMTVHLARKLPRSVIYAFEPVPVNIKTLKRIIRYYRLENVRLKEIALGHEDREIEMVLPVEKRVPLHGLSHVVHESISEYNTGVRYKIPMVRLDSMDELLNAGNIGGIKLDVENFEYFVLLGAERLINKFRPVIYVELWENENRQNCFKQMALLNYKVQVLENDHLADFDPLLHHKQNFFFIPMN